tara:strand:- start:1780 stop:4167 length:2388 start_codon:yes stop_codon:yes gene_type:complete
MKNKLINYLILFFSIFCFTTALFSNEINFEAENIETDDKNLIKASNNVIITDKNGNKIYSNKLLIDNQKKIYTISENVVIENINNSTVLNSEKIIYDLKKNKIFSPDNVTINKNKKYFIETSNIIYNLNTKEISSKEKTIIKDLQANKINVENFIVSLKENVFIANNAYIIDKELNNYDIKKLYYDFNNNRILGQDTIVNGDNKLSSKRYLPRAKSRSILFENGDVTLKKAIYTNCKKREGCSPWSINAEKVKHNKKDKRIDYKNATFKFYDFPILYFPKFFHPDPTVDRQSGFLAPSILTQNSKNYLKTPYFFVLSENTDFTFSPRFYDDQDNIYQGEYRKVTKNTNHTIDASIKSKKSKSSRSHFFTKSTIKTNFDLFDISEFRLQFQNVSNDDYLKLNNIQSPIINSSQTLNSKIEFEGSSDDLEFFLTTEVYEDLSKDKNSDKYEFVLPNFNIIKTFETKFDGFLEFVSSGHNKHFETNINEKILVNDLKYKSYDSINKFGIVNNFEFLLRNFNSNSKNSKSFKNKSENRARSLFQFNSKLPLQKEGVKYLSTITPKIVAKINPQKNKNISNDDRLIDYSNIYSINRLSSDSVLEGGESITIGNEYKIFDKLNKADEIFGLNLAASFRADKNPDLPNNSFLGQTTSNIVGQSKFKLNDFIDLQYDFISDNNLGDFHYHNMNSKFKVNNFVTTFEFIEESNEIGTNHFLANETSFEIDETKSLKFKTRENKKKDLTEYYNLIYQYKMDCLVAAIEYKKDYYSDGSLKPEESLFFSITIMPFENSIKLPGVEK